MERWEGGNEDILGYCYYCKEIVREGEGHVCVNDKLFHYDPANPMKNCYFPEEEE